MRAQFRHIVNFVLLLLVVVYSTPIQFLHNCERFNEHHTSATIESQHHECYLCDIQLTSFLATRPIVFKAILLVLAAFVAAFYQLKLTEYNQQISNKGPPALSYIS